MPIIYIMFIIGTYSGGFATTQEFQTKDRCEQAKQQILQSIGRRTPVTIECMQK